MQQVTTQMDPMAMSFRQLKNTVGSTIGQETPSVEELRSSITPPLFVHEHGDLAVTVFASGWVAFRRGTLEAVFAVDRCRSIVIQYPNGDVRRIYECDFAKGPCIVPLIAEGDRRIWQAASKSMDHDCGYMGDASLNEYAGYLENEFISLSYEKKRENKRTPQSELTARQRQIYDLSHRAGLTQQQIARLLHLSQHTVRGHLSAAEKKVFA